MSSWPKKDLRVIVPSLHMAIQWPHSKQLLPTSTAKSSTTILHECKLADMICKPYIIPH